jgi:hypothetical protein
VAHAGWSSLPLLATMAFIGCADRMSADVALSFLVLGLALSLHALHALQGRSNSAADASVFVFGLMFLLAAPIIQILVLGYRLVNTAQAQPDLLIQTNLSCSLFIAVYLLGRVTVFRPRPEDTAPLPTAAAMVSDNGPSLFTLAALVGLGAVITLISLPFIGASAADQGLTPVLLAFRKGLFFVPTALFLTVLADFKAIRAHRSFAAVLLLLLLLGCVLVTQNPATEKRNSLGPVYLSALFLLFRHRLGSKAVQSAWLVGILLLMFPLVAVLTNVPWWALDQMDWSWTLLSDHFLSTHYDAWANIYTAIEMTARNGLSAGRQLAGALLFYVPSSWWPGKPLATGIEIGNFLMTYYTMWFNNLSAPLIAEGFLDFGYLGVVAYALGLAGLVQGIEYGAAPGRSALSQAVAIYLGFFLVFLLRGSLMIAFAYGSGALAAFVLSRILLALLQFRPARAVQRT